MNRDSQEELDAEIALLRERLESAEEMRRAVVAEELDGFVVGKDAENQRVVLLETSRMSSDALLERLPHSIVTVSHLGAILYANERFAALVGRPLAQLFSSSLSDFMRPECRAPFHRFLIAAAPDSTLEVDLVHSDGRCIHAHANSIAVGNGH